MTNIVSKFKNVHKSNALSNLIHNASNLSNKRINRLFNSGRVHIRDSDDHEALENSIKVTDLPSTVYNKKDKKRCLIIFSIDKIRMYGILF